MSIEFDTVAAASDPRDNVTVMASAGTGKTWLLIARLVRLLLDGAEPGAILAVTFTRKAAGEMQARLTDRLSRLVRMDDAALDAELAALGVTADAGARRGARGLFERLLRAPFPVRTTTFHAFCQEILRRFPLDADVPPGFDVSEDGGLLEQEALDALYAEATAAPRGEVAQALDELSGRCRSPAGVAEALREFLRHRGDWWAWTQDMKDPPAEAAAHLARQLGIAPEEAPEEDFLTPGATAALDEFRALLQRHETAANARHAEQLLAALDAGRTTGERIDAVIEVFLTAGGEPRKRKASAAQQKSLGAAGEQRLLALHAEFSDALLRLLDRRRRLGTFRLSRAWYRAGARLVAIHQRIKRDRRLLDFNDLEWNTYTLLNRGDNAHWVQYKLDQRIDHLLVDEFQDTNPTQWRLLLPLLEELAAGAGRPRSVFLVGDVKQSIYRFRRADPMLFGAAHDWLTTRLAGKSYPLNASWRSAPRIIEFINRVFAAGELHERLIGFEPHASRRSGLWGHVELLPLIQPLAEPMPADAPRGLRNPLLQPRAEELDRRHYREGRALAARIAGLVAGAVIADRGGEPRAVDYGDIMILMRNRTHMHEYELALRDAGIPYLGGGRASLLDSLEIRDMVALLDVLTTPYDNLALATVLRSPLFGCADADLIALAQRARAGTAGRQRPWLHALAALAPTLMADSPLRRAWDKLQDWKARADRMPVHDLLDHIYCDGGVPACYLAVFPRHLHPRVQSNLMRFLELALEIESGRYPSVPRFIASLRELHRYAQEALEEPPAEQGLSGVRLMTIHAAKGLEAPVVFLADAARGNAAARAFQAVVSWPSAADRPRHFRLAGRRQEIDTDTAARLDELAAEETREEANLLYVALTRACQYLYISGCAPRRGDGRGWYGQIAARLADDPAGIDVEGWSRTDADIPARAPRAQPAPEPGSAPDTRLARRLSARIESMDGDATETTPTGGDAERRRGSVIHRMLDLLSTPGDAPAARATAAHEFDLDPEAPLLREWWEEAYAVVAAEELRACFDPAHYLRAYNEMPVTLEQDGRLVHGVIDRLVIGPDGITLLDYKTRRDIPPGDLARAALPHRDQLRRYRAAVHRLWPEQPLRVMLVFTAGARVYECPAAYFAA
ncbi:MAG: UvrD-helicase domain-containing protein [Gammaproteobacteria bacterium]|nr:UvrD-helicase domain-containing protein [Gammaproteobacteria bacterium]